MLEIGEKPNRSYSESDNSEDQGGNSWRHELKNAIRDPMELCQALNLSSELVQAAGLASANFQVVVPHSLLSRMKKGDPNDPLLRQVLPVADELRDHPGFVSDPVGDRAARRGPGLLQKYQRRALLVTTGVCAVHCRYCFRRHYPYEDSPRGLAEWEPALKEIGDDQNLDEVILSGGDPLVLVDETLSRLAERLAGIPHLRRLRIHSRLPIVIPNRVNESLLNWLTGTRLTPIVVVHANHAQEIDTSVAAAISRLIDAGIVVLNQAVLLRGVNDSIEALEGLCRRLVDLRVLPYYLHQMDRVQGGAHFEVPIETGKQIMAELRNRLPGYAVPRYVIEVPGAGSKVPIDGW